MPELNELFASADWKTEKHVPVIEALDKAYQAAQVVHKQDKEDEGTCNMDSPLIKLSGWRDTDIQEVNKESKLKIGDKLSSTWFRNYRFISGGAYGQANLRTRMNTTIKKSLDESGYDVTMWYCMD